MKEQSERKALVLLSGGQDSGTCLYWALQKFGEVHALGFDYGQRHKLELELAAELAHQAGVSFYVQTLDTLSAVSKNALTSPAIAVETKLPDGNPPNTLVEGRNLLFLTFAGIYAKSKGIRDIVIGVSQTDYSGYPDCRNEFIQSAQQTLRLAMEVDFEIHTPLMWLTKAQTWQLAGQLGVVQIIKEKTLTCYNGIPGDGCGTCPACMLRQKGWDEYQKRSTD